MTRHGIRKLDEDSSSALNGGDGGNHLQRLDLQSPASVCVTGEGGASIDAPRHRSVQEEERPQTTFGS
jgi:hypothetical protein